MRDLAFVRYASPKTTAAASDSIQVDIAEYIVRLVGQVVRVSVETVMVVNALPIQHA